MNNIQKDFQNRTSYGMRELPVAEHINYSKTPLPGQNTASLRPSAAGYTVNELPVTEHIDYSKTPNPGTRPGIDPAKAGVGQARPTGPSALDTASARIQASRGYGPGAPAGGAPKTPFLKDTFSLKGGAALGGVVGAGQSIMESLDGTDKTFARNLGVDEDFGLKKAGADALRTFGNVGNAVTLGLADKIGRGIAGLAFGDEYVGDDPKLTPAQQSAAKPNPAVEADKAASAAPANLRGRAGESYDLGNYGYGGPSITGTADKNGRINSFSGFGASPVAGPAANPASLRNAAIDDINARYDKAAADIKSRFQSGSPFAAKYLNALEGQRQNALTSVATNDTQRDVANLRNQTDLAVAGAKLRADADKLRADADKQDKENAREDYKALADFAKATSGGDPLVEAQNLQAIALNIPKGATPLETAARAPGTLSAVNEANRQQDEGLFGFTGKGKYSPQLEVTENSVPFKASLGDFGQLGREGVSLGTRIWSTLPLTSNEFVRLGNGRTLRWADLDPAAQEEIQRRQLEAYSLRNNK